MTKKLVVFFGSFQHYSTKILQALHEAEDVEVLAVVTTPPSPRRSRSAGRVSPRRSRSAGGPNPTHLYAEKVGLPIFTPEMLDEKSLNTLYQILNTKYSKKNVDFFLVAGYGNKLPPSWLNAPKIAPLNLHFSLLPKYRGASPAEWAILMGETETGVTLIKMDSGLDTGPILAQEKLAIEQPVYPEGIRGDTRETLYEHLYKLGADILPEILIKYQRWYTNSAKPSEADRLAKRPNRQSARSSVAQEGEKLYLPPQTQPKKSPTPYARRLQRQDGFLPWPLLLKAITGTPIQPTKLPPLFQQIWKTYNNILIATRTRASSLVSPPTPVILIERAVRALAGYPGVWTEVQTHKGKKRLKILSATLASPKPPAKAGHLVLNLVQLEGYQPSSFSQLKNQLLP